MEGEKPLQRQTHCRHARGARAHAPMEREAHYRAHLAAPSTTFAPSCGSGSKISTVCARHVRRDKPVALSALQLVAESRIKRRPTSGASATAERRCAARPARQLAVQLHIEDARVVRRRVQATSGARTGFFSTTQRLVSMLFASVVATGARPPRWQQRLRPRENSPGSA